MLQVTPPTNHGWTCPKCSCVYSPATSECWRCNNPSQTITVTQPTCTCSQTSSTGLCPIHGGTTVFGQGALAQSQFPTVWLSGFTLSHDSECDCGACNYKRTYTHANI